MYVYLLTSTVNICNHLDLHNVTHKHSLWFTQINSTLTIEGHASLCCVCDQTKISIVNCMSCPFCSHLSRLYVYLHMRVCLYVCVAQGHLVKTLTVLPSHSQSVNPWQLVVQYFRQQVLTHTHMHRHTHKHTWTHTYKHICLKQTWFSQILWTVLVYWSPPEDPDETCCNFLSNSHAEQSGQSRLLV